MNIATNSSSVDLSERGSRKFRIWKDLISGWKNETLVMFIVKHFRIPRNANLSAGHSGNRDSKFLIPSGHQYTSPSIRRLGQTV